MARRCLRLAWMSRSARPACGTDSLHAITPIACRYASEAYEAEPAPPPATAAAIDNRSPPAPRKEYAAEHFAAAEPVKPAAAPSTVGRTYTWRMRDAEQFLAPDPIMTLQAVTGSSTTLVGPRALHWAESGLEIGALVVR